MCEEGREGIREGRSECRWMRGRGGEESEGDLGHYCFEYPLFKLPNETNMNEN